MQPSVVFYEKCVLKNFAKFAGKHLCQSLFFNKEKKKETLAQVFSSKFCEISMNTFFTEQLRTTASIFTENSSNVYLTSDPHQ